MDDGIARPGALLARGAVDVCVVRAQVDGAQRDIVDAVEPGIVGSEGLDGVAGPVALLHGDLFEHGILGRIHEQDEPPPAHSLPRDEGVMSAAADVAEDRGGVERGGGGRLEQTRRHARAGDRGQAELHTSADYAAEVEQHELGPRGESERKGTLGRHGEGALHRRGEEGSEQPPRVRHRAAVPGRLARGGRRDRDRPAALAHERRHGPPFGCPPGLAPGVVRPRGPTIECSARTVARSHPLSS